MESVFNNFPNLSAKQKEQFQAFKEVFQEWNDQINCISRKDMDHFEIRHVLHALAIAKVISFEDNSRVLDVGTGGGFPGIPLAILFPEVQFTLIDGIGKKIKVVQGVAASLDLKNVKALKARSEEIKGDYDYVVARAVARAATFQHWVKHLIAKTKIENSGIYYLKGGDLQEELAELNSKYRVWHISELFEDEFFETKKIVYF